MPQGLTCGGYTQVPSVQQGTAPAQASPPLPDTYYIKGEMLEPLLSLNDCTLKYPGTQVLDRLKAFASKPLAWETLQKRLARWQLDLIHIALKVGTNYKGSLARFLVLESKLPGVCF